MAATQVEEVKAAVESGLATTSTVTTLRHLLGLDVCQVSQGSHKLTTSKGNAAANKTASVPNGRVAAGKSKRPPAVPILEDNLKAISGREKYALATHCVNNSLKLLTDALKSRRAPQNGVSPSVSENAPSIMDGTPQRALRPRSGNISPVRSSPKKSSASTGVSAISPQKSTKMVAPQTKAIVECAQLGFSFLSNADFQALGVREMPQWQLETGLLALVGLLNSHGLEDLAVKQLLAIKQRLETAFRVKKAEHRSKPSRNQLAPQENDLLADALHLEVDIKSDSGALPVAIAYQNRALGLILNCSAPMVLENVHQHVAVNVPNGPVDLIVRQAKATKDFGKAAKQLETLSHAIICLGPSIADSADETAKNPQRLPSPKAMLKLQTIALQIRKLWWKFAKHHADVSHELLEPFYKIAMAFIRRRRELSTESDTLEILETSLESLGPFDAKFLGHALFPIHNFLCSQAERQSNSQIACKWADNMLQDCTTLDRSHARIIAARIRKLVSSEQAPATEGETLFSDITDALQSNMTGNISDYDFLVEAIHVFAVTVSHRRRKTFERPGALKVLTLGAAFCQRYARSYRGRNTQQIVSILKIAIRHSPATDELLTWISATSAIVFVQSGALQPVIEAATTRPLMEVWSASQDALSLSRILDALILKALRSGTDPNTALFDDEKFENAERGLVLEWQLRCAADLASRPKYHESLKRLLPEVLRRLAKIYDASRHPIRRARVAAIAFSIHEGHPNLIAPHMFKVWHDEFNMNSSDFGQDIGLADYWDDLVARLGILRLFSEGRPTADDLKPHLVTWKRIIRSHRDLQSLCNYVDDPQKLRQQLRSISAYLKMLGDDPAALPVHLLLAEFDQVLEHGPLEACESQMTLIQTYLDLGYSDRADILLSRSRAAKEERDVPNLALLQQNLLHVEYLLAADQLEKCNRIFDEAREMGSKLTPEHIPRDQRRTYENVIAKSWLIQSKLLLATGSPHAALTGAKRAVQMLSGIWSAIERSTGTQELATPTETNGADDKAVKGLAKGISKLQLTPSEDDKAGLDEQHNKRGAAFWPLMPVLMKALLHLSQVYSHHGLFNEADYYSQRAIDVAESVGSTILLSRVRSDRSRLLTLAGRTEDAELCLTQDEHINSNSASLTNVDRYCARAVIRMKENSCEEALELYRKAEQMVTTLASEAYLAELESFDDCANDIGEQLAAFSLNPEPPEANARPTSSKAVRKLADKATSRQKPAIKRGKPSKSSESDPMMSVNSNANYVLQKVKKSISVEKALVDFKLGKQCLEIPSLSTRTEDQQRNTFRERFVRYHGLVQNATDTLQMNVTLGLLAESTISLPGLMSVEKPQSEPKKKKNIPASGSKSVRKAPGKTTKIAGKHEEGPEAMLLAARNCLFEDMATKLNLYSTSQTHTAYSSLSGVSLLVSAFGDHAEDTATRPADCALGIDLPRMHALQFEKYATTGDGDRKDDQKQFAWPQLQPCSDSLAISGSEFQSNFIDIMPKPWTAVSLCLSDDCSELYIARYRSGSAPLILKLPFSRHKPGEDDGIDEPAFDYHKGKVELQEIIDLSNYTCHNPGSLDAKGAKTKWWKEREDLDRRLEELLINVENIWFGGFKAILSLHQSQADLLSRFRESFEQVLARHLPSRKTARGNVEKLALDNHTLELFIGLATGKDGIADSEEALTDLLYFVVDMLQFKGERNAYDEIDFDSMVIDTVDALHEYLDMCGSTTTSSEHLILVLDRRLHAFPWERVPFLDGSSISRVASMSSLRDCLLSMRKQDTASGTEGLPNDGEGCHVVCRNSGTYILNPSSDLAPTQAILEPSLSSLIKSQGNQWASIVNEVPNEADFSSALTTSSVTLYFGHGAGSQYIRPRTIKRLERCSEVVWLMGCSSGAVWEYGDLEPCAVPLAYLLAGKRESGEGSKNERDAKNTTKCMAVVATLWDVTDKDIDRFSLALGEDWGLWAASKDSKLPAKTPRKREIVAQPSTPMQAPKTPKTPKVRNTPAIAKTPVTNRSRPEKEDGKKLSLAEAVARNRDACLLRYLNGAAPVVYGVPVYLGD